jgi:hypothetical protein
MTMKNPIIWDVTPCGSYKNQRFRGMYRLHYQGDQNLWARMILHPDDGGDTYLWNVSSYESHAV